MIPDYTGNILHPVSFTGSGSVPPRFRPPHRSSSPGGLIAGVVLQQSEDEFTPPVPVPLANGSDGLSQSEVFYSYHNTFATDAAQQEEVPTSLHTVSPTPHIRRHSCRNVEAEGWWCPD